MASSRSARNESGSGATIAEADHIHVLAEAIPQLVWVATETGEHTYFNQRFYEYTGATPDELHGMDWARFIHPDDAAESTRRWLRSLETGEPYEAEYRVKSVNGEYRWFIGRAVAQRDTAGSITRWFGTSTDIHDQKLAEMARDQALARAHAAQAELRATAERLSLATDAADIGTWDYDPVNGRIEWDDRCREVFQLPGDMGSLSYDQFLARVHPEDRERVGDVVARALDPNGTGEYRSEYRITGASGTRWLEARGRALFTGDAHRRHAYRMIGTVLDVTELKRAQDTLREEAQLVETIQRIGNALTSELDLERVVQTVTDEATRITTAQFGAFFYNVTNEAGEAYMLYTISGAPREAFSKFPMPRNTKVFEPTFHGSGVVRSADITRDPRYGRNAPYHGMPKGHLPVRSYLAVPIISHSNEVMGGLFFGHDAEGVFTERHERLAVGIARWAAVAMDNARLYASERAARKDAERASKAKSDFLATMSHELRTPLNAIGGYAELLELGVRGELSEAQRADLLRIQRAQRHLLSLINDVLNFAKLEGGHVKFDVTSVPLFELVAGLEVLVAPQLQAKNQSLDCPSVDKSLVARADPEKARQVLLNLLSNAIKFTGRNGRITMEAVAAPEGLEVRVKDTGIGIPADKLRDIFEPFVQVDGGLARVHEGTGLGLAISRDLARGMGGELVAESSEGEGSTFTLRLQPAGASPAKASTPSGQ